MTDLVLRPLSFGELLGRAFTLLKHRAGGILLSVFVAMLLPVLMVANRIPRLMEAALQLQRNPGDRAALASLTAMMGGMILVVIVGALGFLVARTATGWIAHKALLGDRADVFGSLEKGLRFLPPMLGLMLAEALIYGVVVGVLYVAGVMLVLGQLAGGAPPSAVPLILWVLSLYGAMVFITTGLFVTPAIMLAEDGARVFGTIGRSFELTKGRRATIFGGILVFMIVTTILYLVVDLGIGAATGAGTDAGARAMPAVVGANLVLNLLAMSWYFVFQMVVYYDLRIRKEGLDLDLAAEASGAPSAPAAPKGRPSASAPARQGTSTPARPSAPAPKPAAPQPKPAAPQPKPAVPPAKPPVKE